MDSETEKDSDDMEELTVSQASKEFHINRKTINHYILAGKLPAHKEFSELGTPYWLFTRGALSRLLHSLPKRGRPRKPTA